MNSKPEATTEQSRRWIRLLNSSNAAESGNGERTPAAARDAFNCTTGAKGYATHPEYPLERLCSHRYEPFQLTFARHAQRVLHEVDEVEVEATHRGLLLRAETEAVFEHSLKLLRNYFGDQIHVGPTTIRYHHGAMVEEPHMGLQVRCSPEHLPAVKTDLDARGAVMMSAEIGSTCAVLHATAPATNLLGYALDLAKLTSASAHQEMYLSHYAPVETPPPDDTAA